MLMTYLPKERILIEADMFNAPPPGAAAPLPSPAAKTLLS
jgi:hypothetical protein